MIINGTANFILRSSKTKKKSTVMFLSFLPPLLAHVSLMTKQNREENNETCDECVAISTLLPTNTSDFHSIFTRRMSTYKLHYGNARGRGEVIRLIFSAAGQKFEDIRYGVSEWPAHKSEMPLGQVPVLEYNGTKLPQSMSIARFLANEFHLAGKDNFDQGKVDAVVDTINDLTAAYVPVRWESDEIKKQELTKKFFGEEVPKQLKNLEVLAKLYGNGGAFFVGNQLTWADLLFHEAGHVLLDADETCLNSHPWLKQNRQEVEKQPTIAAYLKGRPKTAY